MDVVVSGARRAQRWPLIAGLGAGHFLLSLALLYGVRSVGVDDGGMNAQPLGDLLLASLFHAFTVPVLIVRTLLAPLVRAAALDAVLLAGNSLLYGAGIAAVVRRVRARMSRRRSVR